MDSDGVLGPVGGSSATTEGDSGSTFGVGTGEGVGEPPSDLEPLCVSFGLSNPSFDIGAVLLGTELGFHSCLISFSGMDMGVGE